MLAMLELSNKDLKAVLQKCLDRALINKTTNVKTGISINKKDLNATLGKNVNQNYKLIGCTQQQNGEKNETVSFKGKSVKIMHPR